MGIVYFLLALIATTLGGAVGLGGGIIIKPVLDVISSYSLPTINLLSSATIFTMAVVSIIKQILKKDKINIKRSIAIVIGSIIGGIIGQKILEALISIDKSLNSVSILQSIILIALLIGVLIYMKEKDKIKRYNLDNSVIISVIGVILGAISAFLGIGGGPINMAVFTKFFNMEAKESARNSVMVILFSQGSKILSIAVTKGFSSYNLKMLPMMIIGGIIGGSLAYRLNKKASDKFITKIFNITIILIIIISFYNIYTLL